MSPAVESPEFIPRPIRIGERIHPRVEKGRYFRIRRVVAWVQVGLFLAAPWVHLDGHPLFLFNWIERRFVVFGVPFFPQDFHLVALGLVTYIVFVSVFTTLFGRVWCGWACPQTVFLEMVFRPIEALFEGNPNARRRLDAAPWSTEKFLRKGGKHGVFALISFGVGLTGLAYVFGREEALAALRPPLAPIGTLGVLLVFSAVFYGVFAHLREVACVVICPYGRLQSVLTDRRTLTVAYDFVRGEPRGKKKRSDGSGGTRLQVAEHKPVAEAIGMRLDEPTLPLDRLMATYPKATEPKPGDCIDCSLCVQVCPTGIDIRNGANQLECVGCTACIDACDQVMDRVQRPRGLIRYASPEGIDGRSSGRATRRVVAYGLVLLGLLGELGYLLGTRAVAEATVLRAPGQLYQRQPDGRISNLYTVEIVNKTFIPTTYELRPMLPGLTMQCIGEPLHASGGELVRGTFFLNATQGYFRGNSQSIELELIIQGRVVERVRTTFLSPATSARL